jgi:hypothetical protein
MNGFAIVRLAMLHGGEYPVFTFPLIVLGVIAAYVAALNAIAKRGQGPSTSLLNLDSPDSPKIVTNRFRDPVSLMLIVICGTGACALVFVKFSGDPDTPAFLIWGGLLELMGLSLLYFQLRG